MRQKKQRLKKNVIHDMIFCKKKGGLIVSEKRANVRRRETLKAIETLSLLDDNLMTLVFDRNIEATELLLNVILQRNDFKEIHDSYVIFITANDVMGAGYSLYHVDRIIDETGVFFGDGSHIIYVNGSYRDDTDSVGKLMHDFRCLSSSDMFYPVLAKQVKYFKETEGGRDIMCQAFEDLAEERVLDEKVNFIKNLMETMKWTAEQAMEAMKISETDKEHLMTRFIL